MIGIEELLLNVAERMSVFSHISFANKAEFNELVDSASNKKQFIFSVEFPIQTVVKIGKIDTRQVAEEYTIKIKFLAFHRFFGEYTSELTEVFKELRAIRSVYLVGLRMREELSKYSPTNSNNLLESNEKSVIYDTDSNLFGIETTIKLTLNPPFFLCQAMLPCLDNTESC